MGASRTLLRKRDMDVVARVLNNIPPPVEPARKVKTPRPASSYRAARYSASGNRKSEWGGAPKPRVVHVESRSHRRPWMITNEKQRNRRRSDWASPNGEREKARRMQAFRRALRGRNDTP